MRARDEYHFFSQGKVTSQALRLSRTIQQGAAEGKTGDWPTYNVAQGRSGCPSMNLHGTSGPQAGGEDGQGQSLRLGPG